MGLVVENQKDLIGNTGTLMRGFSGLAEYSLPKPLTRRALDSEYLASLISGKKGKLVIQRHFPFPKDS